MSKDVVVVGAGVIGLSTALYAAQRGWRVTVVDRGGPVRDGCSFGNAGMIVPSHFIPLAAPGMVALGLKWMWNPRSPFYIKPRLDLGLLRWGVEFWKAANQKQVDAAAPVLRDLSLYSKHCFQTMGLKFDHVQKGLLMLCKEQRTLDEEAHMAEKARALGLEAVVLDSAETAKTDPSATMDVCGSVLFPGDSHLTPGNFMTALQSAVEELGVKFVWSTEINGVVSENRRVRSLTTSSGEIAGDEFVICGGVWSQSLAKALTLDLPMQAGKGYSLTMEQPPQLPALCSICTEARLAVTPMGGKLRVGGTMELAGIDSSINRQRVEGITQAMPQYFPAFESKHFEGIKPWSGLRPVSPDGMPYIGAARNWRNVVVAAGHAMMGLSLGPGTGSLVTQILAREKTEVNLALCAPDRFMR